MRNNNELQADIDRKNQAEQVLNNPLYKEAFLTLRAHIHTEFEKLTYDKVDDMKECNRQLKTLGRLEKLFEQTIRTGKAAEKTLTEKLKAMAGR